MDRRAQSLKRFALLLALALTGLASPTIGPVALAAHKGRAAVLASVDFEASWSPIAEYIGAHSIVPSADALARIHDETRAGDGTWVLYGPGLGWPAQERQSLWIVFDSEESAASAASQITALAQQMRG